MKKIILTSLLLTAVISSDAQESLKPRGWWKLDDGTGTELKDSSGNGFSGKAENCKWIKTAGRNVLEFSGKNSCITVKDNLIEQKLLKSGSITFWSKFDKAANIRLLQFADYLFINYAQSSCRLSVIMLNGKGKLINKQLGRPETGKWFFCAVTWDEKSMTVYFNGVEVGHAPLADGFLSASAKFNDRLREVCFGAMLHCRKGVLKSLNGCMADIRYFTTALSNQEIKQIYNSGEKIFLNDAIEKKTTPAKTVKAKPAKPVPKMPPGKLVGHWTFNEGYGNLIHDVAGYVGDLPAFGNLQWVKNASGFCVFFDNKPGRMATYIKVPSIRMFGLYLGNPKGINLAASATRGTFSVWLKPVDGGNGSEINHKGKTDWSWPLFGMVTIKHGRWNTMFWLRKMKAHTFIDGPEIKNNEWTHVATTWDKKLVRFYVNGQLVIPKDGEAFINDGIVFRAKEPMYFGLCYPWQKEFRYRGYMDDLRYYCRPLSPVEVMKEYRDGLDKVKIIN